jgi:hypothetical protein
VVTSPDYQTSCRLWTCSGRPGGGRAGGACDARLCGTHTRGANRVQALALPDPPPGGAGR